MWKIYFVPCDSTLNKFYCTIPLSEERNTHVFRVEEYAKQETSNKQTTSYLLLCCLAYLSTLRREATRPLKRYAAFHRKGLYSVRTLHPA
jgi:hypothetical protein